MRAGAWHCRRPARSLRLDGKYPDDAAAAPPALLARPQADVMVVAAYGLKAILPQWTLDPRPVWAA